MSGRGVEDSAGASGPTPVRDCNIRLDPAKACLRVARKVADWYTERMSATLLDRRFVLALAASLTCLPLLAEEARWWKGNTHTHSLWSDGDDFPEMIARFYRERGYAFLVLSDHNGLSRGERWVKVDAVEARRKGQGTPVLEKYLAAFGPEWVQFRGEGPQREVRLRTLEEIRPKFEKAGEFLFIEGEEITDRYADHQIHINAVNTTDMIKPRHGDSVRATMRNNLRAIREQAEKQGTPILAHLNHPNYKWSITAEDMAEVVELKHFEVYNGHPEVHVDGDAKRPGNERLWDLANTLRMAVLKGEPLTALACDDSHHYHGGNVRPGRGWVMVKAPSLSAVSMVNAMEAGDFYASTGITLLNPSFDVASQTLRVKVQAEPGEIYTIRFNGTRKGGENDPAKIGEVLASVTGAEAAYTLKGDEWFVRATVTSDRAHPDPSYPGQRKQAWTQPVWKTGVTSKP